MFFPKHVKTYGIPADMKACVLEGRNLEEIFPDIVMVCMESEKYYLFVCIFRFLPYILR